MLRLPVGTCGRVGMAFVRLRVSAAMPAAAATLSVTGAAYVGTARSFSSVTAPRLASFRVTPVRFDSKTPPPPQESSAAGSHSAASAADPNTAHGASTSTSSGTAADAPPHPDAETAMVHKDYSEETNSNDEDGFRDDAIVVKDDKGNAITRIRRLPLTLIEEVPLPQRILTDLELVMMAWCEEHARQYAIFTTAIRLAVIVLLFIILYVFYRTVLSSERVVRGVDKMPADLRIGSVVYFDVTENGTDIGRIVIGLLNEDCPLYCEYFHRRCTGNGGTGDSFRGMPLAAIVPRHCLIFGDGHEMEHDVPGFDSHFLPTEHLSNGAWRGALSAIAYGPNRESPNFAIHISAGDYKPQVFAIVIGGYNVIERINNAGSKHGNAPKRHFVIEGCGELCTLAKSHIAPMPWKLYESVSVGYDEEKFGARLPPEVLAHSDTIGAAAAAAAAEAAEPARTTGAPEKRKKRWWVF